MAIVDPREAEILRAFPLLRYARWRLTSKKDEKYNCIAWAAGRNWQLWWPRTAKWPRNCPPNETIDAFVCAFQTLGYEVCGDASLEDGYEKVALYAIGKQTKHAARQLEDGLWTSKLGVKGYDIEHEYLESIAGPVYGDIVRVLKRPRKKRHGQGKQNRANKPA
jgi:hypothetical protein